MTRLYFFGLAITLCIVGVLMVIFGFFLALFTDASWVYFWVGLGTTIITAPLIFAMDGNRT